MPPSHLPTYVVPARDDFSPHDRAHLAPSPSPLPLPAHAYRLQTSPLRGYAHHADHTLLDSLKLGDPLSLLPEPANPHDRYAVRVHHRDRHIGYLPRESNHVVSRLLRQGAPLRGEIAWLDPQNLQLPLTLHVLWDKPAKDTAKPTVKKKKKNT